MKKIILLIICIACLFIFTFIHRSSTKKMLIESVDFQEAQSLLFSDPIQIDINDREIAKFNKDNYLIEPMKKYQIAARILKIKEYTSGPAHEILPLDFVLGWKEMSDIDLIKNHKISIRQSNRFYFWTIPSFDHISRKTIEHNSANVHIAPINSQIQEQVNYLQESDLVILQGFLINLRHTQNHYQLKSSLRRDDTGAGACEVLLVNKITKIPSL